MTTTTTEPTPAGILCAVLEHLDPMGRPIVCWGNAAAWRVEHDGVKFPVCEKHLPPHRTLDPEQPLVGTVYLGGEHVPGSEQLRLSALDQAVTASASHMSTEEPDATVARARAFYAFLAAEEAGALLTSEERDVLADAARIASKDPNALGTTTGLRALSARLIGGER